VISYFFRYSYLWKDDAHHTFSQFISGKSLPLSSSSHTVNSEDINPSPSRPNSMLSSSVVLGNAERNFLAPSVSTGLFSVKKRKKKLNYRYACNFIEFLSF